MSDALSCPNDGCQDTFGAEHELRAHGASCPHRQEFCPQCFARLRRRSIAKHIAEECSNRVSTCDVCQNDMLAFQLDVHRLQCQKRAACSSHCRSKLLSEVLSSCMEACQCLNDCCHREGGCRFRDSSRDRADQEKDVSREYDPHFNLLNDLKTVVKRLAAKNSELIAGHNTLSRKVKEVSANCERAFSSLSDIASDIGDLKQILGNFEIETKDNFKKLLELLEKEAGDNKIRKEESWDPKASSHEETSNETQEKVESSNNTLGMGHLISPSNKMLLLSDIISNELASEKRYITSIQLPFSLNSNDGERLDQSCSIELLAGRDYNCYFNQANKKSVLTHYFGIYKPDESINMSRWPPINRVILCVLDPEDEEENRVLFYKVLQIDTKPHRVVTKPERIRFYNDGIPALSTSTFKAKLLCFDTSGT